MIAARSARFGGLCSWPNEGQHACQYPLDQRRVFRAVPPIRASADGLVAKRGYPWAPKLDGGFMVLKLPSRDDAITWVARIARACRCEQELRVYGVDPQS